MRMLNQKIKTISSWQDKNIRLKCSFNLQKVINKAMIPPLSYFKKNFQKSKNLNENLKTYNFKI